MALRDLGYKPYEGERLPAANNARVLLRFGLRRAWSSWLMKVAAGTSWLPLLVVVGVVGVRVWIANSNPELSSEPIDGGSIVSTMLLWQLWLFAFPASLGGGAGVVAQDLTHKSFPFFFSKPVTAEQYLVGRLGAVAIWCFALMAIPSLVAITTIAGAEGPERAVDNLGLLIPALLYSLLVATVLSGVSVGISALGKSRALTMSAWILLFVVPGVIASVVDAISDWPWLRLLAIPSLLDIVSTTLFKVTTEDETPIEWFHALPVLVIASGAGIFFARQRIKDAEVIA